MGVGTTDLMKRLTSAFWTDRYKSDGITQSNNWLLMKSFSDGIWQPMVDNLTLIRTHGYMETATGGALDRHARLVNLVRKVGESDGAFRIRIKEHIRRLRGGHTPDDIISFTEALLGSAPGSVTIIENVDSSGVWQPAFVRIKFDQEIIPSGVTLQQIEDVLNTIAPAGILVKVHTLGGAVFDTGTFDSGTFGT